MDINFDISKTDAAAAKKAIQEATNAELTKLQKQQNEIKNRMKEVQTEAQEN